LAREEALGQLQQERAALEGAQATLKQREDEVSRLNGELVQISISQEDLCQPLEEQEATVLNLQRQAKETRQSLEGEKKQVEGEFTFVHFFACRFVLLGIRSQLRFFFVCGFQACGLTWGR
jgi:chromosome segregation ATPase